MMVEPERLVPGMMASIWKQPILSAVFQSISSTVRTRNRAASASSPSSPGPTGSGRAWAPREARGPRDASHAASRLRLRRSSRMNTTPYTISATATVQAL